MLPEKFDARMRRLLGAEYEAFLESYERPRALALRLNVLKTDCLPALSCYHPAPVPWEACGYYYDPQTRPGRAAWHEAGLYYLQEASAMAPAALLDPKPGERVLDLCAAPGGKSTQLAGRMQGQGLLVCNEIHPKRARILASNIERLGVCNALVLNEHPQRLAERFAGYFDKILVDAPCSGEGMFRKEEAAVADWSEDTVLMCARRQAEILHSAAQMLRPGGRLVYSTCTFAPEENEGSISEFLHTHPEFSVEICAAPWFSPGEPSWVKDPAPGLAHTFRLWPHRLLGEGHYCAVLRREEGAPAAQPAQEAAAKCPPELLGFCRETGAAIPEGKFILFGKTLYLAPPELPALGGLRVLRAWLELGEVLKNRFAPAHAWALWLRALENQVDFPADSAQVRQYLAGEVLPSERTGWTLVSIDGLSLGWAKGDGRILKNHYPKALRRP